MLVDAFEVQYYRLNEVYLAVFCRSSSNPFLGQTELDRSREMLVKLCRGVDVTSSALLKRYAEIYVALNFIIDGLDVSSIDFSSPKLNFVEMGTTLRAQRAIAPSLLSPPRPKADDDAEEPDYVRSTDELNSDSQPTISEYVNGCIAIELIDSKSPSTAILLKQKAHLPVVADFDSAFITAPAAKS